MARGALLIARGLLMARVVFVNVAVRIFILIEGGSFSSSALALVCVFGIFSLSSTPLPRFDDKKGGTKFSKVEQRGIFDRKSNHTHIP
jgi:hypothetical protein